MMKKKMLVTMIVIVQAVRINYHGDEDNNDDNNDGDGDDFDDHE